MTGRALQIVWAAGSVWMAMSVAAAYAEEALSSDAGRCQKGAVCVPFKLMPLPDVSLAVGTEQTLPMVFEGHPRFPVTMEFITAHCSSAGACTPSKTVFADRSAPITANMRCWGTLTGKARWRVVLRDADGVATQAVVFLQTCHK